MNTRLLVLGVLGFLSVSTTSYAATAPAGVLERLRTGQPVELVVEYQAAAVDQEARQLRRSRGKLFDDDAVLALRAQRYAAIRQQVGAALAGQDIDVLRDYSHLPMSFRRFRSLAALEALLAQPDVAAVYENLALHAVLAQSLPLINQPAVAAVGYQGAGTTVAVIDDGIDYTNAAFGGCTAPGTPSSCRVVVSQLAGSATGTTDNTHGTNVSAIVLGVAPASKIAMLDAFSGTSAYTSDIVAAINWTISNRSTYNIVAINMSLGDGVDHTSACSVGNSFATPIANAVSAGISVVVASGNNDYTDGINSPACTPNAIAVGAVYDSNIGGVNWGVCTDATTAADQVACFSNSSSLLTLLAPGAIITAAGISESGTSQATPHVAGAVAVLRAAFPNESLTTTRSRLTGSGVAITDPRNGIVRPRLNLAAAAAPANDAFANRAALSGSSGSATGTSLLATEEAGEPSHGSGNAHSVWWKWTAPAAGQVSLDTSGSGFDTLLGVYTGGAVGALTPVAANASGTATTTALLFEAVAGTQYALVVDGANGAAGPVTLNWSLNSAAKANLSVTIGGASSGSSGGDATYTVTASNAGPQSATNVVVTITLPANASFVSGPASCTASGSQIVCAAGTLASGGQAAFSVVIAWTSASPAAALAAAVTSDLPDPNAADNSASLAVAVADASGDVPTLPEWATLIAAALLLGSAVREPAPRRPRGRRRR